MKTSRLNNGLKLCSQWKQGRARGEVLRQRSISPYVAQGLLVCGWRHEWPPGCSQWHCSSPHRQLFFLPPQIIFFILGFRPEQVRSPGSAQGRSRWSPAEPCLPQCARPAWGGGPKTQDFLSSQFNPPVVFLLIQVEREEH